MLLFYIVVTALIVSNIIINTKKDEWDGQHMRSQEMQET